LTKLGYQLNISSPNNGRAFSKGEIQAFIKHNDMLINESKRKAIKQDLERRIAQNQFIEDLNNRLKSSAY
jgi:hypothetical protein